MQPETKQLNEESFLKQSKIVEFVAKTPREH